MEEKPLEGIGQEPGSIEFERPNRERPLRIVPKPAAKPEEPEPAPERRDETERELPDDGSANFEPRPPRPQKTVY